MRLVRHDAEQTVRAEQKRSPAAASTSVTSTSGSSPPDERARDDVAPGMLARALGVRVPARTCSSTHE